ncbi:hypothetical protein BC827DRAFT_88743 [Russula dissimulans]|nr:hypothetical protein BC827DRAFT_88743 [Russula dissimulans]
MYRITLRSPAVRIVTQATQRSHAHARTLSTVGSGPTTEPTRPTTNQAGSVYTKEGQNKNVLYIGGGLAAVAAIWYYYTTAENGHINKERQELERQKSTARTEGGRERTVQDATSSVKERAQGALQSGDAKYQDVKAEAQSKVQAARDQVGQAVERGKQRFEDGKDQASHRATGAQSTVGESSWEEIRMVRPGALTCLVFLGQKADAAKSTWWRWLSWGKSESQAAVNDLKRHADETQEAWNSRFEEAKRKATEKGEDVKRRLGETEEEFRDRIAKAIQRG